MRSTLVFLAFVAVVRAADPNTTTAAPTTAAPTTAAPTTVAPPPANATWTVKDGEKLPCLILSVATLSANINYNDTKGAKLIANIPIDSSFKVDETKSSCGKASNASDDIHDMDDDAVLTLKNEDGMNGVTLELRLTDNKNITGATSGSKFQWYHARIAYDPKGKYFKDAAPTTPKFQQNRPNNPLKFFTTPNGSVYECKASLQYNVNPAFTLAASGVDAAAYKHNATLVSNKKEICTQDDQTNDLVPIIVGAALAALVVVVLIAYLIGRVRAKRAGGYESV